MSKIITIDLNKELSENDDEVIIEIIQHNEFKSTKIIGSKMKELGEPISTILEYKRK